MRCIADCICAARGRERGNAIYTCSDGGVCVAVSMNMCDRSHRWRRPSSSSSFCAASSCAFRFIYCFFYRRFSPVSQLPEWKDCILPNGSGKRKACIGNDERRKDTRRICSAVMFVGRRCVTTLTSSDGRRTRHAGTQAHIHPWIAAVAHRRLVAHCCVLHTDRIACVCEAVTKCTEWERCRAGDGFDAHHRHSDSPRFFFLLIYFVMYRFGSFRFRKNKIQSMGKDKSDDSDSGVGSTNRAFSRILVLFAVLFGFLNFACSISHETNPKLYATFVLHRASCICVRICHACRMAENDPASRNISLRFCPAAR